MQDLIVSIVTIAFFTGVITAGTPIVIRWDSHGYFNDYFGWRRPSMRAMIALSVLFSVLFMVEQVHFFLLIEPSRWWTVPLGVAIGIALTRPYMSLLRTLNRRRRNVVPRQ